MQFTGSPVLVQMCRLPKQITQLADEKLRDVIKSVYLIDLH